MDRSDARDSDFRSKLAYRHFGSPIVARWFRFGEPAEKLKAMLEVNSGAGFVFNRSSGGKPAFPTCEYAGGEFRPGQVLEESGLIRTEKSGRVRTCRLELGGLSAAEQWIRERRSMWERRLDRLAELLTEPEEGRVERFKGKMASSGTVSAISSLDDVDFRTGRSSNKRGSQETDSKKGVL
jgi:hypothetical protein